MDLSKRIPREIREAHGHACDVLALLDYSFAWAETVGFDVAPLAEFRATLAGQIADGVDLYLSPGALLRRAGIVLPSSVPPPP